MKFNVAMLNRWLFKIFLKLLHTDQTRIKIVLKCPYIYDFLYRFLKHVANLLWRDRIVCLEGNIVLFRKGDQIAVKLKNHCCVF